MTSIRRWLLGWLIFGLAAASGVAAFGIFHTAREEASELFDYELRTVALSLPSNLASAATAEQPSPDFEGIADDRIVIEIWDRTGTLVYHSRESPALERLPAGIRTIERDECHWRVFGLQQPDRFIQVAQPVSVREDLALRLALHTLWPLWRAGAGDDRAGAAGGGARPCADRRPVASLVHTLDRFAGTAAAGRQRAGRNPAAWSKHSTICCNGSTSRRRRSARLSPMPRTSCARRLPR